ncbi:hypothetical protein CORC01_00609 [Colletotrichum orchidophilum]|uniref:Uncharacterized protein n=1 Tax=Colletotrichum orchidophilum TaxID=1209926 RepID=A0A1G4BSA5_9PEZI|nr:uncharacterized protein CORC01_00609 [Colletotrichum orchidophilum]OHF04270.1 hypothetical protein CORC01_00609 [Colletotrichum orchidophilum]
MDAQNALYEKTGLPIVTLEELQEIDVIISALADPEALTESVLATGPMGHPGNELNNVYYINFNPATDTPQLKAQLETVKKNVDLNNSFLSTKAAQTGLNLPDTINTKLEEFLTNIKNTINFSTNQQKSKEDLTFFILMTIYVKDDVLQAWRPQIRTIYFSVDQSLSTYTRAKGDESSGINVDVKIDYVQSDGAFNEELFERDAKSGINKFLGGQTTSVIEGEVHVEV